MPRERGPFFLGPENGRNTVQLEYLIIHHSLKRDGQTVCWGAIGATT